jgi:dUTP pyrophosphatase
MTSEPVSIKLVFVGPVEVPLPRYQTAGAAGLDLHAAIEEAVVLPPLGRHLFPTGLALAIPPGYEAQVRPRSGLAASSGLVNLGAEPVTIAPLQRIAQMVVAPVARAELEVVAELPASGRGGGGYGSTGA